MRRSDVDVRGDSSFGSHTRHRAPRLHFTIIVRREVQALLPDSSKDVAVGR